MKKFIPHVLRNGEFVVLRCEPVTAHQAAAMLETATELLLFVELPRLQVRRTVPRSAKPLHRNARRDDDRACL